MKKIFVLLLLFSLVFLTACTSNSKNKWMRDKRFDFKLNLGEKDLTLVFTKTPSFKARVDSVSINYYKKNEYGEVVPWNSKKCWIQNGSIDIVKDKVMHFNCSLKDVEKEKNLDHYEVEFKIIHEEPLSYKPNKGETCERYKTHWVCYSGGGTFS